MKKFLWFLACFALMLAASYAPAQVQTFAQSYGPISAVGAAACTAATGVSTGGTAGVCGGQGAMFENALITIHTLTWTSVAGTGSVSSCTVQLESSAVGATFVAYSGGASQTCTSSGTYVVATAGANYVKFNVTALTTTGTATVAFNYYATTAPAPVNIVELCSGSQAASIACTLTGATGNKVVYGQLQNSSSTTLTVTGLPFTSSTSYACGVTDITTAANNALKITYTNGGQFILTTTSNSDFFSFVCAGT